MKKYFVIIFIILVGNAQAKEIVQKDYKFNYDIAKSEQSEMYVVSKHDKPGIIEKQRMAEEESLKSESSGVAVLKKNPFKKRKIIYFDLNKSNVKNSESEKLKSLTNINIAGKTILIGYTCELGSQELNESLARERADNVEQFLKNMGIANCQKFSKPKCCYVSSSDLALNRRVEIIYNEIPLAGVAATH